MGTQTWAAEQGARAILGVPEPQELTESEAIDFLGLLGSLQEHLAKGKSIAYYRNEDLGHRLIGVVVAFTYGTPEAQFETPEPPEVCPDGLMKHLTGGINWRYRLCAVTRATPIISDTVPAAEHGGK